MERASRLCSKSWPASSRPRAAASTSAARRPVEPGSAFIPIFRAGEHRPCRSVARPRAGRDRGERDEIISFADIGEHIRDPIKHYSSGMVVRWALPSRPRFGRIFSSPTNARGRRRILSEEMHRVDRGRSCRRRHPLSVLAQHVSHPEALSQRDVARARAPATLRRRRSRRARVSGLARGAQRGGARKAAKAPPPASAYVVTGLALTIDGGGSEIDPARGFRVDVEVRSPDDREPVLAVGVVRADGTPVYGTTSEIDGAAPVRLGPSRYAFSVRFADLALLPGHYRLRAHAMDPEGLRLFDTHEIPFVIAGTTRELGYVRLPHAWPRSDAARGADGDTRGLSRRWADSRTSSSAFGNSGCCRSPWRCFPIAPASRSPAGAPSTLPLYDERARAGLAHYRAARPRGDPRRWLTEFRFTQLIDHADLFWALTRSERFLLSRLDAPPRPGDTSADGDRHALRPRPVAAAAGFARAARPRASCRCASTRRHSRAACDTSTRGCGCAWSKSWPACRRSTRAARGARSPRRCRSAASVYGLIDVPTEHAVGPQRDALRRAGVLAVGAGRRRACGGRRRAAAHRALRGRWASARRRGAASRLRDVGDIASTFGARIDAAPGRLARLAFPAGLRRIGRRSAGAAVIYRRIVRSRERRFAGAAFALDPTGNERARARSRRRLFHRMAEAAGRYRRRGRHRSGGRPRRGTLRAACRRRRSRRRRLGSGDSPTAAAAPRYDFIVCADVLEHLRDGARLLARLRPLLAPGGELLLSVPNVAHAAIIAGLFDDRFEYGGEGLLDPTHRAPLYVALGGLRCCATPASGSSTGTPPSSRPTRPSSARASKRLCRRCAKRSAPERGITRISGSCAPRRARCARSRCRGRSTCAERVPVRLLPGRHPRRAHARSSIRRLHSRER